MSRSWIVELAAAVLVVTIGLYGVSPWFAVASLKTALEKGDQDKLEELVEFSALREDLKAQMSAMMISKMGSDPRFRDNPFSGLALMVVPGVINQAIDNTITPAGLARLTIEGRPIPGDAPEKFHAAKPFANAQLGYKDLNKFVATVPVEGRAGAQTSFIFRRQGLLGWKLRRVELPVFPNS